MIYGTKKLAYEITRPGETYTRGRYIKYTWMGTGENTIELEQKLRANGDILKFLTIKTDYEITDETSPLKSKAKSTHQIVDVLDIIYNL